MTELLSDFLRLRCTREPSAATPLVTIVREMRATCKRPVRRDEVLCALSQVGFKFAIVDRRVYCEGIALVPEWIAANLEPCPGEALDLHDVAAAFLWQSTRAERREVPNAQAELKRLLPIDGRRIVGYRFRPDMMLAPSDREPIEGGKYRKPKHKSEWN